MMPAFFFPRRIYGICSDGTEIQIMCSNVLIIPVCSDSEENKMPNLIKDNILFSNFT